VTSRKSLDDMTSDDLDQLYADLDRAETEAHQWAEADSADAAAGSYALRAERAEQERNDARQRAADAYGQRDRLRQRIAALAERWQLPGHISMPSAAAEIAEALDREKWAPAPDPLTHVRDLADRWENALAPDRAYARALRAALEGPTAPPICELPHQTIDEEDACEQQRLTDAAKDRP
jgi:hypothetical protein